MSAVPSDTPSLSPSTNLDHLPSLVPSIINPGPSKSPAPSLGPSASAVLSDIPSLGPSTNPNPSLSLAVFSNDDDSKEE
jgi:hypothetical protein